MIDNETYGGIMSNIMRDYLNTATTIMNEIESTQSEKLELVSQLFADCIMKDGLVHVYGSGHSRMGVEEMFPRYGSYAGFHPIIEMSTTFYGQVYGANGIYQSMFIENVEGLAAQIVKSFEYKPQDIFLLFSTSGVGNVCIDMAIEARKLGLKVVAITGVKNSEKVISKHSSGQRLNDVADIVLDTCVPIGDAAMRIEGLKYPVGPMSTLANTTIVNMIKVRTAEIMTQAGMPPYVITGSQVIGAEAAKESFDKTIAEYYRRSKRL
jgi:uncharacterized phosphosugar-binding protein